MYLGIHMYVLHKMNKNFVASAMHDISTATYVLKHFSTETSMVT